MAISATTAALWVTGFASDGVGISNADGDGVVHRVAEDENCVAREIDADGADELTTMRGRPVRER